MTPFQIITITGLSTLLLVEVVRFARGRIHPGSWLLRCAIWVAAIVAIAVPDGVTRIAELFGIQRGADLVLYCFALAFVMVSFYFYSRLVRTQRRMTELVRHIALFEARKEGQAHDR